VIRLTIKRTTGEKVEARKGVNGAEGVAVVREVVSRQSSCSEIEVPRNHPGVVFSPEPGARGENEWPTNAS
jgi:hypothetical protein